MRNDHICPICGDGKLSQKRELVTAEYREAVGQIVSLYSECDYCGSEQAGAAEMRANKRAMIAFRKQVDGLLTGLEVRALRERLGINQAEAAKIFGGGPVAFSKYEHDDVAQSEAMDKLLRLTDTLPEVFARLSAAVGVIPTSRVARWQTVEASNKSKNKRQPKLRLVHSSEPTQPRKYA